jgi:hypothetical protein
MAGASRRLLTPEVRFCYSNSLVTAKAYEENGKAKGDPTFSSELILKPDMIGKFLEDQNGNLVEVSLALMLVAVAKEEWPDINVKEAVAASELNWPIIDGDQLAEKKEKAAAEKKKVADFSHYKGMKIIKVSANQDYPPLLSMRDGGKVVTLNRASDVDMAKAKQAFRGGGYGIGEIVVKATKTAQGKFLKFYINSARLVRTGDPIGGGGGGLMSRFDGVQGGKSEHNPMAGLDDEIPF